MQQVKRFHIHVAHKSKITTYMDTRAVIPHQLETQTTATWMKPWTLKYTYNTFYYYNGLNYIYLKNGNIYKAKWQDRLNEEEEEEEAATAQWQDQLNDEATKKKKERRRRRNKTKKYYSPNFLNLASYISTDNCAWTQPAHSVG